MTTFLVPTWSFLSFAMPKDHYLAQDHLLDNFLEDNYRLGADLITEDTSSNLFLPAFGSLFSLTIIPCSLIVTNKCSLNLLCAPFEEASSRPVFWPKSLLPIDPNLLLEDWLRVDPSSTLKSRSQLLKVTLWTNFQTSKSYCWDLTCTRRLHFYLNVFHQFSHAAIILFLLSCDWWHNSFSILYSFVPFMLEFLFILAFPS